MAAIAQRGPGYGVYYAQKHDRAEDKDYFVKMQPPVIKIMDGGKPHYQWAYDNLPAALVVARDWGLDDYHGTQWAACLADPEGTAERHIREWEVLIERNAIDKHKTIFMGINEPNVWVPRGIDAAVRYNVRLLDVGLAHDMGILALSLGVGWPGNHDTDTIKDTAPDWNPYAPVYESIKRGKGRHFLGLHEYWNLGGPTQGWGWLAGRFIKCPWEDVKIIIGECAFSRSVANQDAVPTANQGWGGYLTAEHYAEQLLQYHNMVVEDPRFYGMCVYLTDYANKEWRTKDTLPAHNDIIARKHLLKSRSSKAPVTPPVLPPIIPPVLPPISIPKPPITMPVSGLWQWPLKNVAFTQYWGVPQEVGFQRRQRSTDTTTYKAHEGIDLRAAAGTAVYAVADGVVMYTGFDSAYGNYIRVRHGPKGHQQWDSFYAHLQSIPPLPIGKAVKMGDIIATSGATGTGGKAAHLHLEIRLVHPTGKYETDAPGAIYNGCIDPIPFFEGLERGAALIPSTGKE